MGKKVDKVKIEGLVTVYQEDEKGNRTYLVKNAKNHWVNAGLKGLLSALIGKIVYANGSYAYIYFWSHEFKIYLGSDVSTTTTPGMTSLVSPIGTAPGTAPNSTWGTDIEQVATGVWRVTFVARWNAGTVSGTVGELALYLRPFTSTGVGWEKTIVSGTYTYPQAMVARLSVADGDFSSFIIDPNKSLTVQWEVRISFA